MDYRLSDPHFDPPGMDMSCYREKTIWLPSYWCYEPLETAAEGSVPPALANGFITYGCLNHPGKVSPGALALWLKILRAAVDSRLVLHVPESSCRERLRRQFSEAGMAPERLEFLGMQPREQYLESWRRIDVALDPFPYAGGITTCDALWMGTPVVSLSGETAVGRGGRSILTSIGLEELIADTPARYEEIALSLGKDLAHLGRLRSSLRERMKNSELRNAQSFARNVETAYREMWRNWCKEGRVQ
jgi:protein O-GlcNAc transferase